MKKKVLIVGAGVAGLQALAAIEASKELSNLVEISGFIDDDTSPRQGVSILGTIDDLPEIVSEKKINELIIAIPSAPRSLIERILQKVSATSLDIKIVPGLIEIIRGDVNLSHIRPFQVEDILGREEVPLDPGEISRFYSGKTILVTGAGGSIGSSLVRQLRKLPVKRIIGLGRGEYSMFKISQELNNEPRFSMCLCDILNSRDIEEVIAEEKPDLVFHTAAYKHVPMMEKFPQKAVLNNIIGTIGLLRLVEKFKIPGFVFISTDKAVQPASVMGITKRIGELLTHSFGLNEALGNKVVRFGNVLGSRGSVIETFQQQIENQEPLTVTDPEMTRFFLSKDEAARLVIKSAALDENTTYYLDMGEPIKINDIATRMLGLSQRYSIKKEITYTGLRPGEKLNESLVSDFEEFTPSGSERILKLKNPVLLSREVRQAIINGCMDLVESKQSHDVKTELLNILSSIDNP